MRNRLCRDGAFPSIGYSASHCSADTVATGRYNHQRTPTYSPRLTAMNEAAVATHEILRKEWTDQFVTVNPDRAELKRFQNIIGRVITVNWNNKAVIDFQDGGWYDITASTEF